MGPVTSGSRILRDLRKQPPSLSEDGFWRWVMRPNTLLDCEAPADLLWRGELERVFEAAEILENAAQEL